MIIRPRNLFGLAGVLLVVWVGLVVVASGDGGEPNQVQANSEMSQRQDVDVPANPEPSEEPPTTQPVDETSIPSPTTSQPVGNANSDANDVPQTLWEVPGFRPRYQGPVSDDAFYLREAFKRQRYIQDCMAEKGFDYVFDVDWPDSWFAEIADSLGMVGNTGADSGSGGPQQEPKAATRSPDIDSLSVEELERYYRALYDETTADVEVWITGYLPLGRDTFATGGCFGSAQTAIDSVDSLSDELDEELVDEKKKEMLKAPSCTTPKGVELKDLIALSDVYLEVYHAYYNGKTTQDHLNDVEEDVESCREVLENANKAAWDRAAVTIFERHKNGCLSMPNTGSQSLTKYLTTPNSHDTSKTRSTTSKTRGQKPIPTPIQLDDRFAPEHPNRMPCLILITLTHELFCRARFPPRGVDH